MSFCTANFIDISFVRVHVCAHAFELGLTPGNFPAISEVAAIISILELREIDWPKVIELTLYHWK